MTPNATFCSGAAAAVGSNYGWAPDARITRNAAVARLVRRLRVGRMPIAFLACAIRVPKPPQSRSLRSAA